MQKTVFRDDSLSGATTKRRGVKFGSKRKLSPQQLAHAQKLIDASENRQKVAALFKVGPKTLYRALAG
jgi:Helix-turn-helix domain of resolvase